MKRKVCEDDAPTQDLTEYPNMKQLLDYYVQQQNTKFEQLMDSMETVKEQNSDILKSMDFLSAKYDEVLEKVTSLEQKNKAYESRIDALENKIEHLERNSRASLVELRNIPKQPSETKPVLHNIVKKVAEVINQPMTDAEIHDIYRIKTAKESNNHLVVNFINTAVKDGFLTKCRIYNKTHKENKLNTSHLQLPCPKKPIYVDESLTSLGRRLAYLARLFVKDNKYHSTWTSYGKVYIKKSQDTPVFRIDSEKDLQKLLQK